MSYLISFISGALPFSLLYITGIYLTVKTRFSQIRKLPLSAKLSLKSFKLRKSGTLSSFSSACTAISTTVGTGNIVGVAGALALGGPGAVFWMWVSAIFGMAVKSAEITLSVKYREKRRDGYVGGPMYYIKNGIGGKYGFLSVLFSVATLSSVICGGCLTQSNTVGSVLYNAGVPKITVALFLLTVVFLTVSKGKKGISKLSESLAPFMSLLYISVCLFILTMRADMILPSVGKIIKGAFSPSAVTSGAVTGFFTTLFTGASRGIFSNEAGLGTSGMAHSVAEDANESTQGLFGIFEVFLDTEIICTLTALVILCSEADIKYGISASGELALSAFSNTLGSFAVPVFCVLIFLFGFSSIIGWAMYGKIGCDHLFGEKGVPFFNIIYPVLCVIGVFLSEKNVWTAAGICNGIMLSINLFAILILKQKENITC